MIQELQEFINPAAEYTDPENQAQKSKETIIGILGKNRELNSYPLVNQTEENQEQERQLRSKCQDAITALTALYDYFNKCINLVSPAWVREQRICKQNLELWTSYDPNTNTFKPADLPPTTAS